MYLVIEIQKWNDESVDNIITTHTDLNEAESKFHQVLAAAAISNVPVHAATMLEDTGSLIRNEYYLHGGS